ncbi:MAG: hypothetical protein U0793_11050 [Gemmataceae bacterium]
MTILVQHGHGKSDKIDDALAAGTVGGVILAPRNEKPDNLAACMRTLANGHDCELLIDPQIYVSAFAPANTRFLTEYNYFHGGLSASDFTLRRIRTLVAEAIDFQVSSGVTSILSPTVLFDSFTDRWFQIALNLADASLEYHAGLYGETPLLLGFVLAEEALAAELEVNRFLDTVTQDGWGMQGFYLVVSRHEGTYNQDCDSSRLANLLYAVHVLGHVNSLRVVLGYTDFLGIPLRAVGASAFACGWSQGLRQFVRKNFLQRPPGGQPARDRYSSGPLLNSIFLQELQDIFEVGRLDDVLSGVDLDEVITSATSPQAASWNLAVSQQHHWQTLHALDTALPGAVRQRVTHVMGLIRAAQGLYALLERAGVTFERYTGKDHLANWSRALSDFARRVGYATA